MSKRYTTVGLDELPDPERYRPRVLEWILEAGQPYFDWLLGSREAARAVVEAWSGRSSSELSLHRVRVVVAEGDTVVGGYIALSASDLRRARAADAAALATASGGEERSALLTRLRASRGLFHAPEPGEYYLSKMAVLPDARGRGHGRAVAQAYLEAGRQLGHEAFCLDVAAANTVARDLYESLGFVLKEQSEVPDTPLSYIAMTRSEAV